MYRIIPRPLCLILMFACPWPVTADAGGWSVADLKQDRKSVLLGIAGGLIAHELGHISMATLRGIDFEFDGLSIVYPEPDLSEKDRLLVASAGFQAQWLVSEIAFHYLANDRDVAKTNASAGVILGHLAITAAYLTFLKDHAQGDIEGMSQATGISNDRLALAVALPAVLDTWRLLGAAPPGWLPSVSALTKGIGVLWAWTY